jgi:hypothetical protein
MDTRGPRQSRQGDNLPQPPNSAARANPDIQYHLAVARQHLGRSADAQAMLGKLPGSGVSFTDRAEAERLLQDLKHS